MPIHKVALLGADGKLGPAILSALHTHNFHLTILKRSTSPTPDPPTNPHYPPNVHVLRIPDSFTIADLTTALNGQDALIATIKGSQTDIQFRLAQACVAAGVQRFIPADFGSCDSSTDLAQELVPLFQRKAELREKLIELTRQHPDFEWTSIVCGHFFDWSPAFLHLWPKERRADVIGSGDVKWSASTLGRIGEVTARVLERLEVGRNRVVFVQSFAVTQREVVEAFERVMGGRKWDVGELEAGPYVRERKAKVGGGDLEAVEDLVWYVGTVEGDWRGKEGFVMKELGLEDERLEEVVRDIVESL